MLLHSYGVHGGYGAVINGYSELMKEVFGTLLILLRAWYWYSVRHREKWCGAEGFVVGGLLGLADGGLMAGVAGAKAGTGARSAVAGFALPGGIPVEIEAIFKLKPGAKL